MADLLPPNASPLERRLAELMDRVTDLDIGIRLIGDAQKTPIDFLPFLAWAESVDLWDDKWADEDKRNVVDMSVNVHRHKGTPGSIKQALQAAGYGEVEIADGLGGQVCDGSIQANATYFCSDYDHWAWFTVIAKEPVSIAQAQQMKRIINLTKRECMKLHHVRYDQAHNLCDAAILADGAFTAGVVDGQLA